MGYIGNKMSENAMWAYDQGEKPLSKFTNEDKDNCLSLLKEKDLLDNEFKMNLWQFKDFLDDYGKSSWHHTGKFFNETDFYSFAFAITSGAETDLDEITVENIKIEVLEIFKTYSNHKREKLKKEDTKSYYFADVEYGEWGGTRKYPKLYTYKAEAIICGSFAYILGTGTKKNINGKHFFELENYGARKPRKFDNNEVKDLRKQLKL